MKHKQGHTVACFLKFELDQRGFKKFFMSVLIQWLCATACGIAFSEIVLPTLLHHAVVTYLKALEHRAASSQVVKLEAALDPPCTSSSKEAYNKTNFYHCGLKSGLIINPFTPKI